jgi:hypothetical protein
MSKDNNVAKWPQGVSPAFQLRLIEKEKLNIIYNIKKNALASNNPLIKTMHQKPNYDTQYNNSIPVHETFANMSNSFNRKTNVNFVDDENGKHLLSKGILPSATLMRHDVDFLRNNWNTIQDEHNNLKKELDSLDQEITKKESEIKRKMSEISQNSNFYGGRSVNNTFTKPGSRICGSGFTWSSAYKPSHSEDYKIPEKYYIDPVEKGYKNYHSEYGMFTKTCDLPEPSIYVNPNAKKSDKLHKVK